MVTGHEKFVAFWVRVAMAKELADESVIPDSNSDDDEEDENDEEEEEEQPDGAQSCTPAVTWKMTT